MESEGFGQRRLVRAILIRHSEVFREGRFTPVRVAPGAGVIEGDQIESL